MSDKVKSIVIKGFIAITLITVVILGMSYYLKNLESGDFTYEIEWEEDSDDDPDAADLGYMTEEETEAYDKKQSELFLESHKDAVPDQVKLEKIRTVFEETSEFKDYVKDLGVEVEYTNYAVLPGNLMFRYDCSDGGVFYVHTDEDGKITRFEETASHKNDYALKSHPSKDKDGNSSKEKGE